MKKNNGFVFVETIIVIVILTLGLAMVYSSFSSVLSNDKRRATFNDVAYIYRTYYIEDFITSLNIEQYADVYLNEQGKKIQEFSCVNSLFKTDSNEVRQGLIDPSVDIDVDLPVNEKRKKAFCEKILSDFHVKHLYITHYNVNDLKKCATRAGTISSDCDITKNEDNFNKYEALGNMDTNMIYYLRTLSGKEENDYRIIAEYEEKEIDSDDTVSKTYMCPDGYKEDHDTCINVNDANKTASKVLRCPDSYQIKEDNTKICERVITRNYYNNVKMVLKSKLTNNEFRDVEFNGYSITYNLGGGTAENPTSYKATDETFTLNNPIRPGYTFIGWSGTGISGTSTNVTIPKGSVGNKEFTANWSSNSGNNVKYWHDNYSGRGYSNKSIPSNAQSNFKNLINNYYDYDYYDYSSKSVFIRSRIAKINNTNNITHDVCLYYKELICFQFEFMHQLETGNISPIQNFINSNYRLEDNFNCSFSGDRVECYDGNYDAQININKNNIHISYRNLRCVTKNNGTALCTRG